MSPSASQPTAVLTVYYLDQICRIRLGESITLGRSDDCNISVLSSQASRIHACIENRDGQFIYTDLSTNGSYVQSGQNEPVYLRDSETILQGEGRIFLGADKEDDVIGWVRFRVA